MTSSLLPRRRFLQLSAFGATTGALKLASVSLAADSTAKPARLIVRGDDMGFSHSGNLALIKCYREGIQSSIEVIAPSPWFPEAARLLMEKDNTGIDVGVHLALTSEWDNVKWRPLTHCPSLVDADGYFYPMVRPNKNYPGRSLAENKWKLDEVEREFRAQIELVRKHVPRVSHVSGHMGCSSLSPEVKAMTSRLTKELGVGIEPESFGVKSIRYLGPKGSPAEKLSSFLKTLESLQPGETYLFVEHPGLDTPELRAISHIGYEDVAADRQGVTDTWTHPRVKVFIKERGIQLIGYRDLK
jgi:predicted glycoside hydrolase/deacetylase ChbG (UPF0249 family)